MRALLLVAALAAGAPALAQRDAPQRGPSDEQIRAKVEWYLEQDPWIVLEDDTLDVDVEDGVVEITGVAQNLLAEDRATWLAERVPGVEGVVNQMVIGEVEARPDPELRRVVIDELRAAPALDSEEIYARVDDGVVVLYGTVPTEEEALFAEAAAEEIDGVRGVESLLRVSREDAPSEEAIETAIQRRLLADPYVDASDIGVTVRGSEVRVVGAVGSERERQRVLRAAWVEGVTEVFADDLEIVLPVASRPLPLEQIEVANEDDWGLAVEVERRLRGTPLLEHGDIHVTITPEAIYLEGVVDSERARGEAGQILRDISDRPVENRLRVG